MRRILARLLGFCVLTAVFFASWAIADDAHAAWTPCGDPNPPCNFNYSGLPPEHQRYFTLQKAWEPPPPYTSPPQQYSNGIRGYLSIEDVALHDTTCENYSSVPNSPGWQNPRCDFLANGLMMIVSNEFAQIGFTEGSAPWPPEGVYTQTPAAFTEVVSDCIWDLPLALRGTPSPKPRYNDFMGIRWKGQTGQCSGPICQWTIEKGYNFAPIDIAFLDAFEGNCRGGLRCANGAFQ